MRLWDWGLGFKVFGVSVFSECLGFRAFWGVKVYCSLVLGFGLGFSVQVLGLELGSGLAFKVPLYA